jgi:CBS domain containing-hemolysin-like protein
MPKQGEKVELADLSFEILEVDDKSLRKVRITRIPRENKTKSEK